MEVDVKVAGSSYSSVPAVLLPLTNGSHARFCEVSDTTAIAADVTKGKQFYTAEGVLTVGTNEGSGSDHLLLNDVWKVIVKPTEHQSITYTPQAMLTDRDDGQYEVGFSIDTAITADSGYLAGTVTAVTDARKRTITVLATDAIKKDVGGGLVEVGRMTVQATAEGKLQGYTLDRIKGIPNGQPTHFKATVFCPTGVTLERFTVSDFVNGRKWSSTNASASGYVTNTITGGTEYVMEWDEAINIDSSTKVWDDDFAHDKVTYYCCAETAVTGDKEKLGEAKLTIVVLQLDA